jgi:hypothetical protein
MVKHVDLLGDFLDRLEIRTIVFLRPAAGRLASKRMSRCALMSQHDLVNVPARKRGKFVIA